MTTTIAKGPWAAKYDPRRGWRVFDDNDELIATMNNQNQEAHARLFAAVPEMIELLRDADVALGVLLGLAGGHLISSDRSGLISEAQDTKNAVHAALSRTDGGE